MGVTDTGFRVRARHFEARLASSLCPPIHKVLRVLYDWQARSLKDSICICVPLFSLRSLFPISGAVPVTHVSDIAREISTIKLDFTGAFLFQSTE